MLFACIDDKTRIKVGESDFPIASAERGQQAIMPSGSQLLAGDHDFTKYSLIPSVVLLCDIISGSWYTGQVFVMFKEGAFEPSSPVRHSAELSKIVKRTNSERPVLFIYSAGGPGHRENFMSVKLALIALFRELDLD